MGGVKVILGGIGVVGSVGLLIVVELLWFLLRGECIRHKYYMICGCL